MQDCEMYETNSHCLLQTALWKEEKNERVCYGAGMYFVHYSTFLFSFLQSQNSG